MKEPDIPEDEVKRINTLRSLNILDTPAEERFDRLSRIAKRQFQVPIALVSLVDSNRQWFKSCIGLDARQTGRDISFCGHAILGDECFIISDASKDERFHDNPLVTGEPHIKFYAGCPVRFSDGSKLGTLCVIDTKPRQFSPEDIEALHDLARMVESEIVATHLATIDQLTLLNNKRGFEYSCNNELALCARHDIPASLIYFDLDKFKQVNDKYGHDAGDLALKQFADALLLVCRESDVPGRLSGDEFALLMAYSNKHETENTISRLKEALATITKNSDFDFNFSYGIQEYSKDIHNSINELLNDADSEMYKMKNAIRIQESNTNNVSRPSILIIDDDISYCKLLMAFIEVSYPHAVITTIDPNEYALGNIDEDESYEDYDLIFLDYELGGFKNGLDWFEEKSETSELPPTILNSAIADESAAVRAINAGVMDFLPKTEVSAIRVKLCIDQAIVFQETLEKEANPPINDEATSVNAEENSPAYDTSSDVVNNAMDSNSSDKKSTNEFIGGFELLEKIGQGGMAKIYRAHDTGNNRDVALKVIRTDEELRSELFDRFVEEGQIVSGIDHPNIITIYEEGFTDDYAFIAMELLSKETLGSKTFPLSTRDALYYTAQIASGLATLHSKGIVHRDIKPSNVLFSNDGIPKIADFGIAKDLSAERHLTRQGMAIGTPSYMSPEQVMGNPVNHLSDLYSLGVLLYKMVTGKLPFPSKNQIEVMTAHVQTPPPHLSNELSNIDRITQTLLHKKPHHRYLSASILHDDLMSMLDYDLVY